MNSHFSFLNALTIGLAFAFSATSVAAPTPFPSGDLLRLQGHWRNTRITLNGKPHRTILTDDMRITVKGRQLTLATHVGTLWNFRVRLNQQLSPKQMDLISDRCVLLAIYSLKGDELTLVYFPHGGVNHQRPRGFDDSRPGLQPLLLVFQEVKPGDR
jgi:uncharacterized protein (TIGR03067 family)